MTLNFSDPAVLTTQVSSLQRVKYIPLEIHAVSLLPSASYKIYYNGILVNDFCKPYGGDLGAPLVSDVYGKLSFLFLMSISYNQSYLVNNTPVPNDTNPQLSNITATLELEAPNGNRSVNYIPISLKM